ncbi:MAG TPA: ABC transporter ATP-binding protein, partial [Candidatus Paceibacterota bacterium]|nr:ABC transporter ATP-binding protein [Candidatus Paceibacterota bacterium]
MNIRNNPLVYLFLKMWQYAEGNRPRVVLYISLFVVANSLWALEPLVIGKVLNTIQVQGIHEGNLWYLLGWLGLFMLLELLFWCFHGPARVVETLNAFIVGANYKKYLLRGVTDFPMEWHVDHHSGDTIDKIDKGTRALTRFSEHTFEFLQAIILLSASYIALLFYDTRSAVLVIALTVFTFYLMMRFDRVLIPGYKIVNRIENKVSAKVFDSISNITTIIVLRVKSLVLASLSTQIQEPYGQYRKNTIVNEWKWFTAAVLGRFAVVAVLSWYIFYSVGIGATVLAGTIYILYGYVNQIRDTFFKFAYLYGDIVQQRTSVMNAEELAKDFLPDESLGERLPRSWSEIAVSNLTFSYHADEGANLHLDNVSMKIRRGERIALIGDSGGGKTTFLKLLRDLYHPRSLSLTVDGRPVPGGFAAISESIALVPQDPEIFATTIRENITLGVDYKEQHLRVFTDMARFTDVVARLPHGLESSIVEKGVNLSGGEKQRLALARGLLACEGKDIVLLDEPTSSVDFDNELAIYKNM